MNTKALGELSQAKIIARCLELGFSVSIPFGDNQRYDLILDTADMGLLKVQCKTAWKVGNTLEFNTASTFPRGSRKRINYVGHADLFLVYSPDTDKVYKFPVMGVPRTQVVINLSEEKSTSNMRLAKYYEF